MGVHADFPACLSTCCPTDSQAWVLKWRAIGYPIRRQIERQTSHMAEVPIGHMTVFLVTRQAGYMAWLMARFIADRRNGLQTHVAARRVAETAACN